MTTSAKADYVFLSEFIDSIAPERRAVFIRTLKDAIRTGVFDGVPVSDVFKLEFQGRNSSTRQVENKTEDQRDYAIRPTDEFQAWLTKQQATKRKLPGTQYLSKNELLSGEGDFDKAVAQFRRRGNGGAKRPRQRS